ncbi:MAG: hypothetical protein V9G08_07530 [Dermatophilaceae bacterium]
MHTLIDTVMPTWDHRECHRISINASAETVWDTLHTLRVRDLPFSVLLSSARAPWRLPQVGRQGVLDARALERFPVRPLVSAPPHELVLGDISNYARRTPRRGPAMTGDPNAFAHFATPGWTKAAMSFRITPAREGVAVYTETRVVSTDSITRARFRPYWLLIRLGSGAIRQEILHSARRIAERRSATQAGSGSGAP